MRGKLAFKEKKNGLGQEIPQAVFRFLKGKFGGRSGSLRGELSDGVTREGGTTFHDWRRV